MEDNSANGLKRERRKRKRVALIRKAIISLITIWIFLSMGICTALLYKVHSLEYNLDYLLKNFTVSRQIEAESKQSGAAADESAYFDLEGAAEEYDDDYSIAQAVNQQENLAGPQDAHKVYLTFDDGPSSNTSQILDILKKYNYKATFFVIGKEDEESRELYKRIVEEGHTLAMHSYSHKYNALYDSVDSFDEDFSRIQNYLFEVTGQECLFYRFPGGSSNHVSNADMKKFISYLNDRQITYFDWNVSSGDATSQAYTPEELVENVMEDVVKYKTSIVLMHDSSTKASTVKALEPMIKALEGIEAEILPIDENTTVIQHIAATNAEQQ
ncbi:MAG: polysaccharide deacetylase [Eubacterium sp.]|nr:polysaccharide deacetylase [Eubacterium sp.]